MKTPTSAMPIPAPMPPPAAESFYIPQELPQLEKVVSEGMWTVCQVRTPDHQGTGCLIGGNLLLTNFHVLPDKNTAAKSRAIFFRILPHSADQTRTLREDVRLEFDTESSSYHSKDKKITVEIDGNVIEAPDNADEEHLDFSIVPLKPHSYLEAVQEKTFDIFKKLDPKKGDKVCILQYPKVSSVTAEVDYLKWTIGKVQHADENTVSYNAATAPGSSGGAVVDQFGNLVALHYQGDDKTDLDPRQPYTNSGVLIQAIANFLERRGIAATIRQHIEMYRKTHPLLEARLSQALKSYYKAADTITLLYEDETLPIADYVPLEVVREKESTRAPTDRNERAVSRDNSELEPVHFETLFAGKPRENGATNGVLILGAAGSGKSTLCQYLVYQWANEKLWPQFKAVFWVKLRHLNETFYPKVKDYKASDLIAGQLKTQAGPVLDDSFEALIASSDFCKTVLLILDGYDELPTEAGTSNGHLGRAFNELKEKFPNVLVTSRPQSAEPGRKGYGSFVRNDQPHLKIVGLSDKSIDLYMNNFFTHREEICTGSERALRNYFQQYPILLSMARIPINLTILCRMFQFQDFPWYRGGDALADYLGYFTVTSLYQQVIDRFCVRFLERANVINTEQPLLAPQRHPRVAPLMTALSAIAWKAMVENKHEFKGTEIIDVVTHAELNEGESANLGFFKIERNAGSFVHATFQEYFAALFIANLYTNNQREEAQRIITDYKLSARYFNIFWLAAGHLAGNTVALGKFFEDFLKEPYDLASGYELRLLARCFEECKQSDSIPAYDNFIQQVIAYLMINPRESLKVSLLAGNPRIVSDARVFAFLTAEDFVRGSIIGRLAEKKQPIPQEYIDLLTRLIHRDHENSIVIQFYLCILLDIVKNGQGFQSALAAIEPILKNEAETNEAETVNRGLAVEIVGAMLNNGHILSERLYDIVVSLLDNQNVVISVVEVLVHVATHEQPLSERALLRLVPFLNTRDMPRAIKGPSAEAFFKVASGGLSLATKANEEINLFLRSLRSDELSSAVYAIKQLLEERDVPDGFFRIVGDIFNFQDPNIRQETKICTIALLTMIAAKGRSSADTAYQTLVSIVKDHGGVERIAASVALVHLLYFGAKLPGEVSQQILEDLILFFREPGLQGSIKEHLNQMQPSLPPIEVMMSAVLSSGQILPPQTVVALFDALDIADPHSTMAIAQGIERIIRLDPVTATKWIERVHSFLMGPPMYQAKFPIANALFEIMLRGQASDKDLEWIHAFLQGEYDQNLKIGFTHLLANIGMQQNGLSKKALNILIECLNVEATASFAAAAFGVTLEQGRSLPTAIQSALIAVLTSLQDAKKGPEPSSIKVSESLKLLSQDEQIDLCTRLVAAKAADAIARNTTISENVFQLFFQIFADAQANTDAQLSAARMLSNSIEKAEKIPEGWLIRFVDIFKMTTGDVKQCIVQGIEEITKKSAISDEEVVTLTALLQDRQVDFSQRLRITDNIAKIPGRLKTIPESVLTAYLDSLKGPQDGMPDSNLGIFESVVREVRTVPEAFITALIAISQEEGINEWKRREALSLLQTIATTSPVFHTRAVKKIFETKIAEKSLFEIDLMRLLDNVLKRVPITFKNMPAEDFECLKDLFFCTEYPLFYERGGIYIYDGENKVCLTEGGAYDVKRICDGLLKGNLLHSNL